MVTVSFFFEFHDCTYRQMPISWLYLCHQKLEDRATLSRWVRRFSSANRHMSKRQACHRYSPPVQGSIYVPGTHGDVFTSQRISAGLRVYPSWVLSSMIWRRIRIIVEISNLTLTSKRLWRSTSSNLAPFSINLFISEKNATQGILLSDIDIYKKWRNLLCGQLSSEGRDSDLRILRDHHQSGVVQLHLQHKLTHLLPPLW